MSVQNIQVRPQKVTIGKDIAQVQKISTVADVASSLNNKYFLFRDAAGAKRYVWYNVATTGVDPAPAGGWLPHVVAISANASAAAVATATAAVLDAVTGFDSTASGNVITLTHTAIGFAEPAYEAVSVGPGFAYAVSTLGFAAFVEDCLAGEISLEGFETEKLDILCHATGTTVLDQRITGYANLSLSLTFQDTAKASIERLLRMYGMYAFTPVGADKESVFGYGPSQVGGANPKVQITLHPVSKDAADKSEDYNLWMCELSLESFTFSGTDLSQIPATFAVFPDTTKPKAIQFFMYGDAAKAGY